MKISVTPATFLLLICMIATTPMQQLCACLAAATIHELGHIAASKLLGINLSHLKLDVLGARLTTRGKLCSYPALVALCIAGPAFNFICFCITLPLTDSSAWIQEFCLSSLSLGLLNLIPIEGFDGGRIVHGLLSMLFPLQTVDRVCVVIGFFSLLCMWLLSVWLLLRTGTSLTLFVFSCCLFGMLFA